MDAICRAAMPSTTTRSSRCDPPVARTKARKACPRPRKALFCGCQMLMWGLFLFLCEQKGDWSPVLHTILFMWCIGYANDYRAHLRKFLIEPLCQTRQVCSCLWALVVGLFHSLTEIVPLRELRCALSKRLVRATVGASARLYRWAGFCCGAGAYRLIPQPGGAAI